MGLGSSGSIPGLVDLMKILRGLACLKNLAGTTENLAGFSARSGLFGEIANPLDFRSCPGLPAYKVIEHHMNTS